MYKPTATELEQLAADTLSVEAADPEVKALITAGESRDFYQGFISGLLLAQRAIGRALGAEIDPMVLAPLAARAAQMYIEAKPYRPLPPINGKTGGGAADPW